MAWQLLGMAPFMIAGEMFNKSIIFCPDKYNNDDGGWFITPYWLRRCMAVCNIAMFFFFIIQIFVPTCFPFISKLSAPSNVWDENRDATFYDGKYDYRTRGGRRYHLKEYDFGKYYVTSVPAYELYCWSYFLWAIVALALALFEYKQRTDRQKLLEEQKAEARASGLSINPIHNIIDPDEVGTTKIVVISGEEHSIYANMMGTYKLQGDDKINGAPVYVMNSWNVAEKGKPRAKGKCYLYRSKSDGGLWSAMADYGGGGCREDLCVIRSTHATDAPNEPGLVYQIHESDSKTWHNSKIKAVDPNDVAPGFVAISGDAGIQSNLMATYVLQGELHHNGYPVYTYQVTNPRARNLAHRQHPATAKTQPPRYHPLPTPPAPSRRLPPPPAPQGNLTLKGFPVEEGTAYLYRSADGGNGDGRWRIARRKVDMATDVCVVKTLAPAAFPTSKEVGGWTFLEDMKWRRSKVKAKVAKPSRTLSMFRSFGPKRLSSEQSAKALSNKVVTNKCVVR